MTLGDIIREYRTSHNISQDEFARRTELSKAYISILERNFNPSSGRPPVPSLETIRAVASALNLRLDDVLLMLDADQRISLDPDVDAHYARKSEVGEFLTAGEQHLLDMFRDLNSDGKEIVVDLIDSMVASGKYSKTQGDRHRGASETA